MKTIYMRNLIEDLLKHKIKVCAFLLICTVLFGAVGYKKASETQELTDTQKQLLEEYNTKITEYDQTISDAESSLELVDQQMQDLQIYIDNSIYMKLDSQNLQIASVQYGIKSDNNIGNILSAFTFYINEGGLKEDASNEYSSLQPEYWREIIACSTGGNILNITVTHYDSEMAQQILNIVKERIQQQAAVIAEVQGEFVLEEIDSTAYVKSDVGIANTQNNNLNNLKNYTTNRIDLNNKLISQQNNKASYIEKNKPEVLEAADLNPNTEAVKFAVAGLFFGVAIPCVILILQYILGNSIRSSNDLEYAGYNILNTISQKGEYNPSLERSLIDINYLSKNNNLDSIFFDLLNIEELNQKVLEEYKSELNKAGLEAISGKAVYEDAKELQQMISCKGTIIFIKAGKTTYPQFEKHIHLCKNVGVTVLGCVVFE